MFNRRTATPISRSSKTPRTISAGRGMIAVAVLALLIVTSQLPRAVPVAEAAGPLVYWGAIVNGLGPSSANLQPGGAFDTFEARSKKKMSIIHWGQAWMGSDGTWGEFQTSYFDNVRSHGAIPMLNWASWRLGGGASQPDFQLRDIYAGTYDTYLTRWATAAKSWGHPFFLRFNHEMNGWWYPWAEGKESNGLIVNGNSAGDYVKAWRHVHDLFVNVGATNITWVWCPNYVSDRGPLTGLYPGDAYADWTCLDGYNRVGDADWLSFNQVFTGSGTSYLKNSYQLVLNLAPNKPMMIAETATREAGDGGVKKAAWIRDALLTQIPTNFPRIKAVVWFNWDDSSGKTYPIETSQAATDAWAAGIGSPVYASNRFGSLNASPIPALTGVLSTVRIPFVAVRRQ